MATNNTHWQGTRCDFSIRSISPEVQAALQAAGIPFHKGDGEMLVDFPKGTEMFYQGEKFCYRYGSFAGYSLPVEGDEEYVRGGLHPDLHIGVIEANQIRVIVYEMQDKSEQVFEIDSVEMEQHESASAEKELHSRANLESSNPIVGYRFESRKKVR